MVRIAATLLAIAALVSNAAPQSVAQEARERLAASRDSIERWYYSFDAKAMEQELGGLDAVEPAAEWYAHYYRAILCTRLSGRFLREDEEKADELLDCAQQNLEAAIARQEHADLLALLGSVLGRRIAVSPIRAMWLGPRSLTYQNRALEVDSLNPRAVLEMARSKMFRPRAFGGDRVAARELLIRSIELHERYQTSDTLMVDWGGPAEAYAFLAILERDNGNYGQAREYAEQALDLVPYYALVRDEVLPSVQRAEEAAGGE